MTTNRLTTKQKRSWRSIIIRHYGHVCFYCKDKFLPEYLPFSEEWDHLNCKEWDNRIENVVLAHRECNNKKKYNPDWQILAIEHLEENEKSGVLVRECEREKTNHRPTPPYSEEIYSNAEFTKIAEEYLAEHLAVDERIPYKSTLDTIAYRCYKAVGHGTSKTLRDIVDMLASAEAKYEVVRDGGKRWIQKRNQGLFSV